MHLPESILRGTPEEQVIRYEKKEILPADVRSFGILAIKPHAVSEGHYAAVYDLLMGNNRELAEAMRVDPEVIEGINNLTVCGVYIRDPSQVSGCPNCDLLDVFYTDALKEPYYSALKQILSGPQVLYLLGSSQPEVQFYNTTHGLKGRPRVVDPNGTEVLSPKGIRGAILPTAVMSEHEYQTGKPSDEDISRMLKNVLHTTDGAMDTRMALELLLGHDDRRLLQDKGFQIEDFMDWKTVDGHTH